jgi:hypothetical protein
VAWGAAGECILPHLAMPRPRFFPRLSLAVLLLAVFGSVASAKPKVAILGLEALNAGVVNPTDAANAAKLTEELRAIPRGGVGKYEFAPNSNRELQDEKLMGNCDTERPTCMAPIGSALGADFLIYGSISKTTDKNKGEGYKAKLYTLNIKTKLVERTSEGFVPMGTFNGGTGPVKEWAQKVYAELSGEPAPGPERVAKAGPGKVVVNGNVKSGDVFIGADKKGRLEGGTITLTLPDGTHELAVESPGHKRYEATITVKSGQTRTVTAELEQIMGDPPKAGGGSGRTIMKVSGIGMAAVFAATGGYWLYLTVSGPERDYENELTDGMQKQLVKPSAPNSSMSAEMPEFYMGVGGPGDCDSGDGKAARKVKTGPGSDLNVLYDKACNANTQRWITGPIAIASGVAAVGLLYFAFRDTGAPKERQAGAVRKRRQLTVTPVISPSGGSATVRFDW